MSSCGNPERTLFGKALQGRDVWFIILLVAAFSLSPTVATAGGGTVTGTVRLGGGETRLEDVLVSIEGLHYPATDGKAPAPAELALDQKDLTFVPHVLAVPAGATVTFRNDDSVLHNVRSNSTVNPPFNFAMMKGKKRTTSFEHPEVIPVSCNVHSEMSAVILVKDNPFYARPAKDGRFTITGIPSGNYTIQAWHERAGTVDQKVAVTEGGTITVNFTLGK